MVKVRVRLKEMKVNLCNVPQSDKNQEFVCVCCVCVLGHPYLCVCVSLSPKQKIDFQMA